jgi:mRNA interferase HicA
LQTTTQLLHPHPSQAGTNALKYSEFKRYLSRQGATFTPGKGSHLHVELNGRSSIFPNHGSKEIPMPLVNAIKKDLGL